MFGRTDAYLQWSHERAQHGFRGFLEVHRNQCSHVDPNSGSWDVQVVDIFYAEKVSVTIAPTDHFIASALVRHGVIPCSPISPTVTISIDALELYRVTRLCSPHLSIQAFVKSICDLHGTVFHRYLSRQFSISFDLYLQLRSRVDSLVNATIHRTSPDWRLRNACPCCTYELKNEPAMTFRLLYAMDGNDSLKRRVCNDRYLSREYVNEWANPAQHDEDSYLQVEPSDDENPCAGSWGVYDETGVFLAVICCPHTVCRHGFCLLIADMVQSGELAKYPLSVVAKLLDALGSNLGSGYDIGCQFKTTLDNSALGPRARLLHHTCLVGAFHGHAHKRLCQLYHLATYVTGLRLEGLETCERTFSKSNALASMLRYASVFHRQQLIATYFEHNNEYEVYPSLGNFLHNNYKQALNILSDGEINLKKLMQDIHIPDESVFERWLQEERDYLHGLHSEPEHETLQMEYWQKLTNLAASQNNLDSARSIWASATPASTSFSMADAAATRRMETARRHTLELFEKDLTTVQELEIKLDIVCRWVPDDPEWQNAGRMVAKRRYQRALDTLEGLVVARIFELTKMNRSGTGYKLRKHIAKALQTHSAAICTALDRYNTAALALTPPRRTLKWDEVIEYAFLADFDLLRDAREDVSERPWATPASRQAMDLYFKMCRAKEEIVRLNIEIRRLITYIRDEDRYLRACEAQTMPLEPALSYQIGARRLARGRANGHLLQRLADIAELPGFSGCIIPGESSKSSPGDSASTPHIQVPSHIRMHHAARQSLIIPSHLDVLKTLEELEEEEEGSETVEEAAQALHDVLRVSAD
ncbi:hypothetical protein DEU56DRAFT_869083 [Suillus clintonianus]|uniref:uncharacterized protein n=1 Tax=Suillus clintonianus TaxID=1904413 RepID=UPI001B8754A5|nr:uncharacterized protein DEU56DRAFT_869083 [Suillus clintonianus]KAG2151480.1 hypothetical protein DEU56DRAFT_869083 [Suillus clintonianus]